MSDVGKRIFTDGTVIEVGNTQFIFCDNFYDLIYLGNSGIRNSKLGKRNMDTEKKTPTCRMAYVLNNKQPVICTIVSDQPLFYMDYEEEFEDEVDDYALFGLGADGQTILIEKEDGVSVMSDLQSFLGGKTALNADACFKTPEQLVEKLRISRMASALLDIAQTHNTIFKFSSQIEDASYDHGANTIFIRPDLDRADQTLLAARELRRVWQHRNGALIDPLQFHPDQAILVNRAQIADLSAMMVRIAWELQLAGDKEIWQRLELSSMGDIARSFARDAHNDFRNLDNGNALSSAFESWFLSNRCQHEDRTIIQNMLAGNQSFIMDDEAVSKQVTTKLIMALGSLPYGKNYLLPYINTITTDSVFTDVRDRSNANFLWFIKFERTFHETEHNLQSEKDINNPSQNGAGDIHSTQARQDHDDHREQDHEKTPKIISFPQRGSTEANQEATSADRKFGASTGKNTKNGGNNIISITDFAGSARFNEQG